MGRPDAPKRASGLPKAESPLALLTGVHLQDVESRSRPMADIAALAESWIGLRLRVRHVRRLQMARQAGRCGGRNRSQQPLRIGHRVQTDREAGLRVVRVTHVTLCG